MKTQRVVLFAAVSTLILMLGAIAGFHELFAVAPPSPSIVHNLHVMKVQNKWKVLEDSTKTRVVAKREDYIVWKAKDSDVYFQFPDSTLFKTEIGKATAVKPLRLQVSSTADTGRYPYAAFCMKDSAYATGDSPPVIIVR